MQTDFSIIEVPEYQKHAKRLLDNVTRQKIIEALADNPELGMIIRETNGIRKLRWGIGNRGKRGGVRIIYFFHNEKMSLFLLTLFDKNKKEDLSKHQYNKLAKIVTQI